MIILKSDNGKTLYPSNYEYNVLLIVKALCKVIENHDGRVKPSDCTIKILNRGYIDCQFDIERKISRLESNLADGKCTLDEKREEYLSKLKNELEDIKKHTENPVEINRGHYLSFILDDDYYYFQLDDNPFFEFYYIKTPIRNGEISKDACLMELSKDFLWDDFLRLSEKSQEDYKESANILFNTLVGAKYSTIRRDKHRTRVPNTYNNGYHYETIYSKERKEKIDF